MRIAGPFLTAAGGYPSGRDWAPAGAVVEIADPRQAALVVDESARLGCDLVKLVLHDGAPLLSRAVLDAAVAAAHRRGLPVGVHAEGRGQARRAMEAGADLLVHVPWTERLDDALIEAMAASMTWISTLVIHPAPMREQAIDNARRFVAAGGRLVYGTDLGNGPGPCGPRPDEIEALGRAGLAGDALLSALTSRGITVPTTPRGGHRVDALDASGAVHAPLPLPRTAADAARWFAAARRLGPTLAEAA